MILTLFVILEIVMISFFVGAFFTKQEILWALTSVLSGILMFTSFNVKIAQYVFNSSIGAYEFQLVSNSFPYMMGVNLLFFALALMFGLFDLFDKYGITIGNLKR
jgi:hypothetical protein